MTDELKEILDLLSEHVCDGCEYGCKNCLLEGKAYCKTLENEDENG